MKNGLLLLLLASSAEAHAGPDGGLHHGLPYLIMMFPFLKIAWDAAIAKRKP